MLQCTKGILGASPALRESEVPSLARDDRNRYKYLGFQARVSRKIRRGRRYRVRNYAGIIRRSSRV